MKSVSDYQKNLDFQCDYILKLFKGEKDSGECSKKFSAICKYLTNDFLPPVDREDIAALSYSLLEISNAAANFVEHGADVYSDELLSQLIGLKSIIYELLNKKKTCGESIRRLMDKNILCGKMISERSARGRQYAENLNSLIADFLRTAHNTYFKNL